MTNQYLYIVQTVRKRYQRALTGDFRTFDQIDTIASSHDFLDAKQSAINYCHSYGRQNQQEWNAPKANDDFATPPDGDRWKQIAPWGFEVELANDQKVWVRIDCILVGKQCHG